MAATALTFAQEAQPAQPLGKSYVIQSMGATPENQARVVSARQLMERGGYEPAAALLEIVHEKEPQNQLVSGLLKTCYVQLRQYFKAEALIRAMIVQSPEQLGPRLELAELLADQGLKDSARVAYREVLAGVEVTDSVRYLLIIRSEMSKGLEEDALKLIDEARARLGDSMKFALERGGLFEKAKQYEKAVHQYVPLLQQDTSQTAMEAERRLVALLGFPETAAPVERLLTQESRGLGSRRVLRLLDDYAIKAGNYDKAFQLSLQLDSLEDSKGVDLLYFMRQCSERGAYPQTVKMAALLSARYPSCPISLMATMLYAEALAETGQIQEAMAQYDRIATMSPNAADKGEAIYLKGMLYLENLRDYRAALSCFDTVVSRYHAGLSLLHSLRGRALCYLRMGELDSADVSFGRTANQTSIPDFIEEAAYYRGLIKFFKNDYDSSGAAMHKLLVDFPQGFYVNDALQLIMTIDDAREFPELMDAYGKALLYSERQLPDSARIWLERLTQGSNAVLADDALYRLTLLNIQLGDTTGAVASADQLIAGYADSYYAPYGIKIKADILVENKDKLEDAKALYRQVLEKYPNYPFASEVRKKLRQLETGGKIG